MIQTHIHHDGSASVHVISHPTLRGVRMSAYLSPAGELTDAEAYRSGGSGRPIRLSAAARAHALKEARAAVLLVSVANQECARVFWLSRLLPGAAVPQVPMSDEEAEDIWRVAGAKAAELLRKAP